MTIPPLDKGIIIFPANPSDDAGLQNMRRAYEQRESANCLTRASDLRGRNRPSLRCRQRKTIIWRMGRWSLQRTNRSQRRRIVIWIWAVSGRN